MVRFLKGEVANLMADGAALASAIIAAIAAIIAVWSAISSHRQAKSAKRQAVESEKSRLAAESQARSARTQAEEAKKSRELAESSVAIARAELERNIDHDESDAKRNAQLAILEIQSAFVDYGMSVQKVANMWNPGEEQSRANLVAMIEAENSGISTLNRRFMENMGYLPGDVQQLVAIHLQRMHEIQPKDDFRDGDPDRYHRELREAGSQIVQESMVMLTPRLMNEIMNYDGNHEKTDSSE